jgi:hypothetical protein
VRRLPAWRLQASFPQLPCPLAIVRHDPRPAHLNLIGCCKLTLSFDASVSNEELVLPDASESVEEPRRGAECVKWPLISARCVADVRRSFGRP